MKQRRLYIVLLALAAPLFASCTAPPPDKAIFASEQDGANSSDDDVGTSDSGTSGSGIADSGEPDSDDASTPPPDAAQPGTGQADSGEPDAGDAGGDDDAVDTAVADIVADTGEPDAAVVPCQGKNHAVCAGICVDTNKNHQHCGGCAKPCNSPKTCKGGKCK